MAAVHERPACAATVSVIGQLRAPGTSALRRAVTGLLLDGERHIRLDLAALTDLDAAGIGELVNVSNMTTAAGGTLQIAHARTSVRRVLDAVGLLRVLEDTSAPSVNGGCGDEGSSGGTPCTGRA
jgi:anti-sigma B factor antagonist